MVWREGLFYRRCVDTAIVFAVLAAVLYGTGAAFEQHQAAGAPDSAAGRLKLLGLLIRQPLWVFGITVQAGGFIMHAIALHSGALAVVQMVVAAEFIVSVTLVRIRSGRRLSRNVWAAIAAVMAGIAGFLALTSAAPPTGSVHAVTTHAAGSGGATAAVALAAAVPAAGMIVCAAVGLAAAGRSRALVLAVAAGLADTCTAVVTKALSQVAGHGAGAIASSWPVYALVAGGLCSVLLTQTAYQAGRPMITLPVIAAVTPAASVAVGAAFLGDAARMGALRAAAAGAVALATSAAIMLLVRTVPAERAGRAAACRPGTATQ